MIANIINRAASLKSWFIELIIDKKPQLIFNNDIISEIAINLVIDVSSIFMLSSSNF
ncbi:hypothetical protein [uncultured Methanobrevibacter sp.]|uniref:hypothetical protein n=1 Tax=uncultured Methanobrevibacter sp. TaxID=253161 RepID=UPI0025D36698|nr:hypothetical protein [uncultured Methanobrevibacter sp.]